MVVPSYFSAFGAHHANIAPIQVIADGSEPNTANFVQNYVQGAWQDLAAARSDQQQSTRLAFGYAAAALLVQSGVGKSKFSHPRLTRDYHDSDRYVAYFSCCGEGMGTRHHGSSHVNASDHRGACNG